VRSTLGVRASRMATGPDDWGPVGRLRRTGGLRADGTDRVSNPARRGQYENRISEEARGASPRSNGVSAVCLSAAFEASTALQADNQTPVLMPEQRTMSLGSQSTGYSTAEVSNASCFRWR